MVNINEVKKTMEKSIKDFESAQYQFETVVYPRYQADKDILRKLKDDYIKVDTISRKMEKDEDVSQEEIYDAVPEAFR